MTSSSAITQGGKGQSLSKTLYSSTVPDALMCTAKNVILALEEHTGDNIILSEFFSFYDKNHISTHYFTRHI